MASFKLTLTDTIYVLAGITVISLLIAFVISRHEPAWIDFILHSTAVMGSSALMVRLINWPAQRRR